MRRLGTAGLSLAPLLLLATWGAGRLMQPAVEVERLPVHAPDLGQAVYDSSVARLGGELSAAASRLLATHRAGPAGNRVVALLREADWRSCEDLGRQLRELQRNLSSESVLLVWTDLDDVPLVERRLKRERIAAPVSAGPALDSVFTTVQRLPTPAVVVVSEDGARAEGIAHTRRIPNVRTRSFAEELPLVRQLDRPSPGRPGRGAGPSFTSSREPPS